MNELLQQSILDAFSEIQKWSQQFIFDDAGNSVDLASVTLGQQSTTPLLARNQPTTFPHRRSPTKDVMIPKSQAIADGNFYCKNRYHIVTAGQNEWWCWNFDRDTSENV
jgi:hypothetical protein